MIKRQLLITLHLYLASFFTPMVVIMAVSGGLYLIGIKGEVSVESEFIIENAQFDGTAVDIEQQVKDLLSSQDISHSFDYIKGSKKRVFTRPTSEPFYHLEQIDNQVKVTYYQPDIQKRLIELHKGHGPTWFKTFQKVFAVALIFVMISGLWLGLSAKAMRRRTLIAAGSGLLAFVLLVFVL
jgi:hypothetical protein